MTYAEYRSEVDRLLKEIYIIGIDEIGEDIAKKCFYSGDSPQEFVDWIGLKYDLIRFDYYF